MTIDLIDTFPARGRPIRDGLIKMKLAHARGVSIMLPDFLLINFNGRWKWFQPHYFSPCYLSFLGDQAYGQLSIDLNEELRLFIGVTKDRFVRRFRDGSQLYRCRIAGPADLENYSTGRCSVSDDHDIWLDLFHHTLPATVDLIRESGHFRASSWNIQGTRELANIGYAYFTSLPAIRSDEDLQAIAMASNGKLVLRPTNASSRKDLVVIDVYRQSTLDRTATIIVSVPVEMIATQHVYRHAPRGEPVYYEACHPAIARVGLQPGRVIRFDGTRLFSSEGDLKLFNHVVLGDADTHEGLVSPYDEESTASTFIIEHCLEESFFDYWLSHQNSDQIDVGSIERMVFR